MSLLTERAAGRLAEAAEDVMLAVTEGYDRTDVEAALAEVEQRVQYVRERLDEEGQLADARQATTQEGS